MSLETKAQANVIYMQTQKHAYRITRQDFLLWLKSRQQWFRVVSDI